MSSPHEIIQAYQWQANKPKRLIADTVRTWERFTQDTNHPKLSPGWDPESSPSFKSALFNKRKLLRRSSVSRQTSRRASLPAEPWKIIDGGSSGSRALQPADSNRRRASVPSGDVQWKDPLRVRSVRSKPHPLIACSKSLPFECRPSTHGAQRPPRADRSVQNQAGTERPQSRAGAERPQSRAGAERPQSRVGGKCARQIQRPQTTQPMSRAAKNILVANTAAALNKKMSQSWERVRCAIALLEGVLYGSPGRG